MAEDGSYLPPVVLRIIGDDADLIRTLARDKELLDAFDGSSYEAKLTLDSTPAIAEAVRARSELEAIFSAPITQHVILDSGFGTVPELALPPANFQTTFDSTAAIEQATATRAALDAIATPPIVFTAAFDAGNVVAEAAAIIASQNLSPVTVQVTANDSNLIATLAGGKALLDDFSSRVYTANLTATGTQAITTATETRAELDAIAASSYEAQLTADGASAIYEALKTRSALEAIFSIPITQHIILDTTGLEAAVLPATSFAVEASVDTATALAQLEALRAASSTVSEVPVSIDVSNALSQLTILQTAIAALPTEVTLHLDVDSASALTALTNFRATVATSTLPANIQITANIPAVAQTEAARSTINALVEPPAVIPLTTEGTTAIAEALAVRSEIEAVFSTPITQHVVVDSSGLSAAEATATGSGGKGGGGGGAGFLAGLLGGRGGKGGFFGTLGWGGGLGGFWGFPGFAGFGSVLGLAGLGAERAATTVGGVAASGIGALGGAGLLGAGVLGTTAVGAGSDIAVFRDAQAEVTAYGKGLDRLNRAIAIYGANSTQARAAQYDLNQVTKAFSPALLSAVQATNTAKTALTAFWDQQTSMAKVSSLSIMDQVYKLGTVYTPLIAQAAGRNLGIINNDIKPLFAWLEGPEGIAIFQNLENIFASRLPTAIHAFTQGVEIIIKTVNVAAGSTGGFITKLDAFLTRTNSPTGFAVWQTEIGHLIGLFHDWAKLGVDLWGVMRQLFKGTTGLGTDIVVTLDQMLIRLHNWLSTVSGQQSVHNLFLAHRQEIDAILAVLPQLLSGLGQFYLLIAPALTHILTFLIQIASFVVHMPIVGPFLAWAAAILLISNRMKLLTLVTWAADILKFAASFVVLAGAQGIGAALSALPIFGSAIGKMLVYFGLLDAATATSVRGMLTFGSASKAAAATSAAAMASSAAAATSSAVVTDTALASEAIAEREAAASLAAFEAATATGFAAMAGRMLATAGALAAGIAGRLAFAGSYLAPAVGMTSYTYTPPKADATSQGLLNTLKLLQPAPPANVLGINIPFTGGSTLQSDIASGGFQQELQKITGASLTQVNSLIQNLKELYQKHVLTTGDQMGLLVTDWKSMVKNASTVPPTLNDMGHWLKKAVDSSAEYQKLLAAGIQTGPEINAAMAGWKTGLLSTSADINAFQQIWGSGVTNQQELLGIQQEFDSSTANALGLTQDAINQSVILWQAGDTSLKDRIAAINALTGLETTLGPTMATYMQSATELWGKGDHSLRDQAILMQTNLAVSQQTSALSNSEQLLIADEFVRGHGSVKQLVALITAEQAVAAITGPLTGDAMRTFQGLWDKGVTKQTTLVNDVQETQIILALLQQKLGVSAPLSSHQMDILVQDLLNTHKPVELIVQDLINAEPPASRIPQALTDALNAIGDITDKATGISGAMTAGIGPGGLINIQRGLAILRNLANQNPSPNPSPSNSPASSFLGPPPPAGGGRNFPPPAVSFSPTSTPTSTNLPTITIPIEIHIHGNATAGDAQRIGLTVQQAVQAEVSQVVRQLIGGAA